MLSRYKSYKTTTQFDQKKKFFILVVLFYDVLGTSYKSLKAYIMMFKNYLLEVLKCACNPKVCPIKFIKSK